MTDRAGRADLHYAALDGDERLVSRLLDAGADPDQSDVNGFTPLHFASQSYEPAIVRLLVDRGATVDQRNSHGNTALFIAVRRARGRGDVIKALLKAGADPSVKNNAAISPLAVAERIANYDNLQYFPGQSPRSSDMQ